MSVPAAALNAHIAILGTTGGGKTYTARGLVERLLNDGRRICILDPVGVWWGIKANAAGDGPGYEVAVFGGDHADVEISEASAAPLAKMLAGTNLPAVIDTSEMGVGERTRFMTAFLTELYRVNRQALWLVMEEADEIAPQRAMPEATRLLDAADRIARRGRARGFRLIAISQRPAVIHKNVLTQIRCMVAHRLTAPQDTKAVHEWIRANADEGQAKKVISSLPKLDTGEAWVWAPEHGMLDRVTMPGIGTFDSSRTPDADEEPIEPVGLAEADLSAVHEALKVEEKSTATTGAPDPAALSAAEQRGYERGLADGQRTSEAALARLQEALSRVRSAVSDLEDAGASGESVAAPAPPERAEPPAARPRSAPKTMNGEAPSSARKLLTVLDTNPPIRLTWAQAAALAGLKARGGHFNAGRKWLLDQGKVIEDGDGVRVPEPSADATDASDPAEAAARMRANWRTMLPAPANRFFEAMEGGLATKAEIAERYGMKPTGGHWNSGWAILRRNDLIVESGNRVRLADWLGA